MSPLFLCYNNFAILIMGCNFQNSRFTRIQRIGVKNTQISIISTFQLYIFFLKTNRPRTFSLSTNWNITFTSGNRHLFQTNILSCLISIGAST